MARADLERPVQQSVLDRLIDEDPRSNVEEALRRDTSEKLLKAAVRRDLETLLNTRRIPVEVPEEYEELRHSVFLFGLPDITSMSRDDVEEYQRLLRMVEDAIILFEPRLANVRVSLIEGQNSHRKELHFRIEALLRMDPTPEHVMFDALGDPSSGKIEVKGEAGG